MLRLHEAKKPEKNINIKEKENVGQEKRVVKAQLP